MFALVGPNCFDFIIRLLSCGVLFGNLESFSDYKSIRNKLSAFLVYPGGTRTHYSHETWYDAIQTYSTKNSLVR